MVTRKGLWLLLGILIIAAMLLASCGKTEPTATPTTTSTSTTTATTSPTTKTTTTPTSATVTATTAPTTKVVPTATAGEPQYGGTITVLFNTDVIRGFDPFRFGWASTKLLTSHCLESLGVGDWSKGPGGTKEYAFDNYWVPVQYTRGALAESWEISPDGLNYTFHIRKGIYFHNKPPANGREMTAADVKYCWDRRCGTGSGFTQATTWNAQVGMETVKEITVTDKYTVVFRTSGYNSGLITTLLTHYSSEIYPPEVIQTYGSMDDWKNCIGTGAFVLTDYVPASAVTFEKNPNYWGNDELHPKNKLPYADRLKLLIIPDQSTQLTAMRVGQAEILIYNPIEWRIMEQLKQSNPDLQFGQNTSGTSTVIHGHMDTKPWSDLKVRRALQMSIDSRKVKDVVWGTGGGSDYYSAVLSQPFGEPIYTPFNKLPDDIKENLTYNPTKAKQLLAEAGYPNGFTIECVIASTGNYLPHIPFAEEAFAKIGVKLDIQLKESSVISTLRSTKGYNQLCCADLGSVSASTTARYLIGPNSFIRYTDKVADDLFNKAFATVDESERWKVMQELNIHMLRNVYFVGVAVFPPSYEVAQPWLKGWHGEMLLRVHDNCGVVMRLWLDQDLKKARTGKK